MVMFYHSVVASIIFYAVVFWVSVVKTSNKRHGDDINRLYKLIRKAGSVIRMELESLLEVSERRMLWNLLNILNNMLHPLYATLESYWSTFSRRLRSHRITAECHRTLKELSNSSFF